MLPRRGINRFFTVLVVLMLLLAGTGCKILPDKAGQPGLTVSVIDVGQGDAILIRTAEQVALVDTGDVPARDRLVAYLKAQGITAIDHLIITHPHSDHIGGAAAILAHFKVGHAYDSGQATASPLLGRLFVNS